MIVVHRHGGLLMIKQLDHAAVAGAFAAAWGNARFEAPEPRDGVILAASRHDEGWREWDEELHRDPDTGTPLHFLDVGIEDYVALYSRGIQRIADLDPYAGILVSMHGTGNVCGRWGIQHGIRLSHYDADSWSPVIRKFVLKQEAFQSQLKLDLLGLSPEIRRSTFERQLWFNYELLQGWDRLSLFLCRTDPGESAEAELGLVPTSQDGCQVDALHVRSEQRLVRVRPWPFSEDRIEVEIVVQPPESRLRWIVVPEDT